MTHLDTKVAVVTGAGAGIGRALAVELGRRGARLAVSDINADALASTVQLLEDAGVEVHGTVVDVSKRADVDDWAEKVVAHYGVVHAVFNNAGVGLMADFDEASIEQLERVMDINFWGVVHGTKAFLPHVTASGDGHIVNISSLAGIMAASGQTAYCSSKFAVRGFTEALRQEMLVNKRPVRVTCVHPGGIKTDFARNTEMVGRDATGHADRFDKIVARTTAESAARQIADSVERDRARALIGVDAKIIDAVIRIIGPRYQRIVAFAVAKLQPPAAI